MAASACKTEGRRRNRLSLTLMVLLFASFLINLAATDLSQLYLKNSLVPAQVNPSYQGPAGAPIELGPIGGPGKRMAIHTSFSFEASESQNYPNLFQTAAGNSGIRLELNNNVLALIISGEDANSPPNAIVLSETVHPGTAHTFELFAIQGRFIEAIFDGERLVAPVSPDFSTSDVRLGSGFDNSRNFSGTMGDIRFSSVQVGSIINFTILINEYFSYVFTAILIGIFLSIACYIDVKKTNMRDAKNLKQYLTNRRKQLDIFLCLASLLMCGASVFYFIISNYFSVQYELLRSELLAGFQSIPGARHFKNEFIIFVLLELVAIGALGLTWAASTVFNTSRFRHFQTWPIALLLAGFALLAAASTEGFVSRLMSAIALALAAIAVATGPFLKRLPEWPIAYALAYSLYVFRLPVRGLSTVHSWFSHLPQAGDTGRVLRSRTLKFSTFFVLVGILSTPMFAAWYPVEVPNDYMELTDFVPLMTTNGELRVDRDTLVNCLNSTNAANDGTTKPGTSATPASSDCQAAMTLPPDQRAELRAALQASGAWQSEAGRLLFHHAYLYVPAKHLLTYGFDGAVPYLYGYGNTIFHASLMQIAGGPSLSNYFLTFPFAEYAGIVAAAALVLGITGSATAAFVAFLLSISAFYMITYVPVFLAASFSPLRLFGLMIQIGAMAFFCASKSTVRYAVLPLSAAASLFWNREFGQIGAIGQALIIVAPYMALSLRHRILLMAALLASVAIASRYPGVSQDIVNTVGLSFFNISQQSIPKREFAWIMLYISIAQLALFALSMAFEGKDRALRLALIPVLALSLVKFVFNPAAPHFYIMCTLLWPVALIYLPWSNKARRNTGRTVLPLPYSAFVAVSTLIFAIQTCLSYQQNARDFRGRLIESFSRTPWTGLNETISFVAPEQPIRSRVTAIQSQMRMGDKVLFLSPFDHILSFYVNPQSFCGHFDLLTNFATYSVANAVSSCVSDATQLLVVYDKALEIPCPTDGLQEQPLCQQRAQMKHNLIRYKDELLPMLQPNGFDGDLVFYRRDRTVEVPR